eukprot:1329141-Rhodomonas_salina.1
MSTLSGSCRYMRRSASSTSFGHECRLVNEGDVSVSRLMETYGDVSRLMETYGETSIETSGKA